MSLEWGKVGSAIITHCVVRDIEAWGEKRQPQRERLCRRSPGQGGRSLGVLLALSLAGL